jgi:hypothetical protein
MGDPRSVRAFLVEVEAGPPAATRAQFATHLGRLSLQFWRPDFSPDQAKVLYGDFMRLLAGVTERELSAAVDDWMMDPANKFFPTPGMLHAKLKDRLCDRAQQRAGAKYLLDVLDGSVARAASHGKLRTMAEILAERKLSMPVPAADQPETVPDTARPETPEAAADLRDKLAERMARA